MTGESGASTWRTSLLIDLLKLALSLSTSHSRALASPAVELYVQQAALDQTTRTIQQEQLECDLNV